MSSAVVGSADIEIYNSDEATAAFRERITAALAPELERFGFKPDEVTIRTFELDRHGDAFVTVKSTDE